MEPEHLDQLLVLQSMYPDDFEIRHGNQVVLCQSMEDLQQASDSIEDVSSLRVDVQMDLDGARSELSYKARVQITLAPQARVKLERITPSVERNELEYLRSQLAVLSDNASGDASELVLLAADELRDALSQYTPSRAVISSAPATSFSAPPASEYRIWFWLISLSTPSKRRDLVTYARARGLTGFVLAGKPGLVCVEGASEVVDDYMADIKARSWSDIPSYQKKITERLRQQLGVGDGGKRAFATMDEITDMIDQRGARGNRGDMKQVREYLEGKGLAEVFGKVIGTTGVT